MLRAEQVPFGASDYYCPSLLSLPVDQTSDMMEGQCWYGDTILAASGFSEVQRNAIYDVTENTQTDASAEFFNYNPLRLDPMTDLYEVKNYDSSIERSRLPFYRPQESSGYGRLDSLVLSHCMPKEKTVSSETLMNIEWQQPALQQGLAFPVQDVNMRDTLKWQTHLKGEADISGVAPKSSRSISRKTRERSKEAECRRRSIVSQRVQALQELLPATSKDKRGNQESILHDVIGHIKYLQLQLKELSVGKLGGDLSSTPLKFVEGYGHYHSHEQMFDEPFEEILGNLFEENPGAARKLLESRGLHMLPMASVDALLSSQG